MTEEKGRGWEFWLKLVTTLVAVAGLFGLGTLFYEQVWRQKKLTYTVLPSYDLQNQFFTGLIVENRGRVTLTDVQIVVSDLESRMLSDPYMPGAHEPATVVSGGKNQTEARIELPRLSKGASLPVYILTPEEVSLEAGNTFYVSSRETPGVIASDGTAVTDTALTILASTFAFGWLLALLFMLIGGRKHLLLVRMGSATVTTLEDDRHHENAEARRDSNQNNRRARGD